MDYLQYFGKMSVKKFKYTKVLNLIINGLPSIQKIILNIFIKDFVFNIIINLLDSIQ